MPSTWYSSDCYSLKNFTTKDLTPPGRYIDTINEEGLNNNRT